MQICQVENGFSLDELEKVADDHEIKQSCCRNSLPAK